jgi:hypothetical protein
MLGMDIGADIDLCIRHETGTKSSLRKDTVSSRLMVEIEK